MPAEIPIVAPGSTRRAAARAMACFSAVMQHGLRAEARLVGDPGHHGEGPAVHPLQQPLAVEPLDVAAHGHVRDAELVDEVGDAHRTRLLDQGEDGGAALAGEHAHPSLTTAAVSGARRRVGPTSTPETRSWPAASTSQCSCGVVEHEEPAALGRPAPDDLHPGGGHGGRRHPGLGHHPVQQRAERVVVRERAEVPGDPVTDRAPGHGGAARQRPRGVRGHDLGVDGTCVLAPLAAGAAVGQRDRLLGPQREELLDPDAEQVAERSRVPSQAHVVVVVADAGEVGDQHVGAALRRRRATASACASETR